MAKIAIIFGVLITLPGALSLTAPCTSVTDPKLYIFPGECSKFIQCAHGDRVEKQCPIPLNFNVDIQACDWYFKVDCSVANAMEEFVATTTTTVAPTKSTERAQGCPSDIEFGIIAACDDPTGVQYVVCEAGVGTPSECTDGMVYNKLIQSCSSPTQLHACLPAA